MTAEIQTNDLLIRAAWNKDVERPPMWVMRQAGRYLPQYHKAKGGLNFFETCRDPEVASEITLQPIVEFAGLIDAAIIFSDILVIPQALGMTVEMHDDIGPVFPEPIRTPEDLHKLRKSSDITEELVKKELGYVYDAISLTQRKLRGEVPISGTEGSPKKLDPSSQVPLIGFCGAPWTLAAYMIARNGKTFNEPKSWIRKYPEAAHDLLQRCTDVAVPYLIGQVEAGAQLLQVFDSWAGELDPSAFNEFALPYLKQIASRVDEGLDKKNIARVPKTIFAKGAWFALDKLCSSGYQIVGLDWTHDPAEAMKVANGRVVLQGNMDPAWLIAGRNVISQEINKMILAFGGGKKGYIVNLGHGIFPSVNKEDLRHFFMECRRIGSVKEVHDF